MEDFSGLDSVVKKFYNDEKCAALREEFSKNKHVIGIAGNIGVGKSTLANILGGLLNCLVYKELDKKNPYLDKFYKNPKEWAYKSQLFFLEAKSEKMNEITGGSSSAIVDRTIYEDIGVFARAQKEFGYMSKEEWADYERRSREITENLPYPDMILYLRGNPNPTLMERINERKRPEEMNGSTLDVEYLHLLNGFYELMVYSLRKEGKTKIGVIETDYSKQEILSHCEKNSVIEKVTGNAIDRLYKFLCAKE